MLNNIKMKSQIQVLIIFVIFTFILAQSSRKIYIDYSYVAEDEKPIELQQDISIQNNDNQASLNLNNSIVVEQEDQAVQQNNSIVVEQEEQVVQQNSSVEVQEEEQEVQQNIPVEVQQEEQVIQQEIKETEKEPEIEIEFDHTHDDTTDHGSKLSLIDTKIEEVKEELSKELQNPNIKSIIQEDEDLKIITSSSKNQLPIRQEVDRLAIQQLEIDELKAEIATLEKKSN